MLKLLVLLLYVGIALIPDLTATSLSTLTLEVLCGLQRLSPDMFQQVNFRPAKLLPSSLSSSAGADGDETRLALQANISAYESSLGQVCIEG